MVKAKDDQAAAPVPTSSDEGKFTQSATEPALVPVVAARDEPKTLEQRVARIEVILRAQGHDV